jgi:phosphohistidine phosphatase
MTLILLRHGKSDWHAGATSDHERPINERGRREAARVARFLSDRGWTPDIVLCSAALRTRQTWEKVALTNGWDGVEVHLLDDLYLCSANAAFEVISRFARDGACMLVVGHQPTLSGLASGLSDGSPLDMPTATAAILRIPVPLEWRGGELVDLRTPKSLMGPD